MALNVVTEQCQQYLRPLLFTPQARQADGVNG
jgi:hypothetical protein